MNSYKMEYMTTPEEALLVPNVTFSPSLKFFLYSLYVTSLEAEIVSPVSVQSLIHAGSSATRVSSPTNTEIALLAVNSATLDANAFESQAVFIHSAPIKPSGIAVNVFVLSP